MKIKELGMSIAMFLIASCSDTTEPPMQSPVISGRVIDEYGFPIAGAILEISYYTDLVKGAIANFRLSMN